ncbi:hypothetical protein L21SP5_00124 [Salinivirga cyanobacteriivorans]|uniref:Uncharacterized protein n=2 Tax=Salinivirga cyanobacteriivorans TaxID=1307839 RepID=A0A0S2HUY8_9BACT|nr:hypothetical protein L21SP5_00124 [Salinivirga cyanobacteriivorans]
MDYSTGTELWKYQWDFIHNPEGGWHIFEDVEEGALITDESEILEILDEIKEGYENGEDEVSFNYGTEYLYNSSVDIGGDEPIKMQINLDHYQQETRINPANGEPYPKDYIYQQSGNYTALSFEGIGSGGTNVVEIIVEEDKYDMLHQFLYGEERFDHVFLSDVQWYSQFDTIIGCNGSACCCIACKYILSQYSGYNAPQNTDNNVAVLKFENDYTQLLPTVKFTSKLAYLVEQLNQGNPVVVGVHYARTDPPYNANSATRHFLVIVGMGYDETNRQNYFRYYEVGTNPQYELSRGKNELNKLYLDQENKFISGYRFYDNRYYTITEIRKNE